MNKSLELSAILRRSCEKTRERNLVLFHALLSAVSDVDHSVNDWSHLSNASICAVLRCCLLGSASPRFIFVLGSNAVLLRSPDLGSAWTKIFPIDSHSSALPPAAEEKVAEDDEVSRITQLMSPADGSTTSSIEEDATEARSPPRQQVTCVSAFQDIVAVGGPHGYVALSGNRGMSFTTVPKKIVALGSQEEDFLHISCVDLTHILIATGRRVIRLDIQMDSLGQVSPCGAKLVLTCAGAIGLLTSYSWSSRSRECVVAEPLAMHLSWDAGENFLRVFHALGSIRSVDALTALRRAELPRFGEVSRIYSSAVQSVPTSGEDKTSDNKKSNNNSYEYSSGYTVREGNAVDRLRSLNLHEHFIPSNSTPNMFFRYFMVCGVGTEVINYDYSALLFVGVTVAGNQATVFSVADHVSYIPFTHSGLSEPMACVVQRGPLESKTPIVAVRANSMGVSFSHNFTKWSAPKKGACVGLVPADGGQLVVAGQRNLFSRFQYAESVGEHAMPSSLRVPSVQQVASSV